MSQAYEVVGAEDYSPPEIIKFAAEDVTDYELEQFRLGAVFPQTIRIHTSNEDLDTHDTNDYFLALRFGKQVTLHSADEVDRHNLNSISKTGLPCLTSPGFEERHLGKMRQAYLTGTQRLVRHLKGRPTQDVWMVYPPTVENEPFPAADRV